MSAMRWRSMAAVISTAQVDALLVQQPTEVGRLDHSEELLGKVIFEIIVRKKYRRQRVTRNRQPAGIGQWAARPDNAHTGHGSSSRAVWFGSVDTGWPRGRIGCSIKRFAKK